MARRFISGIRMDRSWSLSRTRGELGRVVSVSGARKTKRLRRDALLTVGQPSRLALEGARRRRGKARRLTYVGQPSRLALEEARRRRSKARRLTYVGQPSRLALEEARRR